MAPIASGSFLTDGMVICPCSGGTSGRGLRNSTNLIHRAAEVHQERRPLVLVPRETPLSITQLDNMASRPGRRVILPGHARLLSWRDQPPGHSSISSSPASAINSISTMFS